MSQFTSKAIMSVNKLSIDDNTWANTCAKCYHDEIVHVFCYTIHLFAQSSCIGIIGNGYRNVQFFTKHLCKRNLILLPRKVRGHLYVASIVVGIRGSYSQTNDFSDWNIVFGNKVFCQFTYCLHIFLQDREWLCLYRVSAKNFSFFINQSYNGIGAANVYAKCVLHVFMVCLLIFKETWLYVFYA